MLLFSTTECGEDDFRFENVRNYSEYAACMPPDEILEDPDFSVNMEDSLNGDAIEQYWGDMDEIRRRGVLRVLTRNNGTDYYLYRGRAMGFEYELAGAFAESLGVKLQMVVAPARNDLVPWLQEGRGDIICAGLAVTPARLEKVRFSYPYAEVTRVVVSNEKSGRVDDVRDLAGPLIAMRNNSTYIRHLLNIAYDTGFDLVSGDTREKISAALLPNVPTIKILEVKPELEDVDILAMVAAGEVDALITDSDVADVEAFYKRGLLIGMEVSEPLEHSWAMRRDDSELWLAANNFIRERKQSGYIAKLQASYFKKNGSAVLRQKKEFRFVAETGQISPFDELFKKAGKKYGIDWRMLASLAYQESRFDSQAQAPDGAVGIMQLMPETAAHLGVRNPMSAEESINAGARYIRILMNKFGKTARNKERILMALAAYNVGYGHIEDARKLAAQEGLDPDRWFGNVEKAALMLKQHKYASHAKFGYFRCDFTLKFVNSVQARFEQYVAMTGNE